MFLLSKYGQHTCPKTSKQTNNAGGFFFPSNVISCISTLIPYILRGNVVNKDQIAKTVIFTVDMLCMQLYIVYNKR